MPIVIAILACLLAAQALFALWLNVYTWDQPDRLALTQGPARFAEPRFSFTVLLPARHEEAVIAETIRKIATARYPQDLLEIVVVCHVEDVATISAAEGSAREGGFSNVRVHTFTGTPVNKPRGLNEGVAHSLNTVVCVFDAEDDVHPDIFNVANTVMVEEGAGVVQAGVQLVSAADRWFSLHNCLEYFFWFKSRLHFHAQAGMVPLGGNTVFLLRSLLQSVGGWDERCLTEDAEIGIRLSARGERIRVVYHRDWVTREETPPTVAALIKQRTRWHQGFLQILARGHWRRLPSWSQRLLALVTLAAPLMDAALLIALPVVVLASLFERLPVPIALLTLAPLYAVLLQIVTSTVGAVLFAVEFKQRLSVWSLIRLPFTYLPYQWLLSVGAVRAVVRQMRRQGNWEKTEHRGTHRVVLPLAPGLREVA